MIIETEALNQIQKVLGQEKWMVIGGYNLVLHGIDRATSDIDISTTLVGIEKLKNYFRGQPGEGENWKGVDFQIDGLKIQVMSEESGPCQFYQGYLAKGKIDIISNIPCLNLVCQLEGYRVVRSAGRGSNDPSKQIELIEEKLKNEKSIKNK